MKTIIVVYSTLKKLTKAQIAQAKKYAFATEEDLEVGDIIKSKDYDNTPMHIVKVVDKSYKYYNSATGKLSNTYNSTTQWDIKTIMLKEDNDNIVHAVKQ